MLLAHYDSSQPGVAGVSSIECKPTCCHPFGACCWEVLHWAVVSELEWGLLGLGLLLMENRLHLGHLHHVDKE